MHAPAHVFIFVNGILANPGAHDGWTDRAVTWVHLHTHHRAEKFEYHARALTRRLRQGFHAAALRALVRSYRDRIVHLVGHSNGCDIILRAIAAPGLPRIASLHLIAGACEADFRINGLNDALLDAKVGQVYAYVAGHDSAMKWARVSRLLFGWAGLGYGTLGLTGPLNVDSALQDEARSHPAVVLVRENSYGHSSWFDGANFERTLRRVTTHHL